MDKPVCRLSGYSFKYISWVWPAFLWHKMKQSYISTFSQFRNLSTLNLIDSVTQKILQFVVKISKFLTDKSNKVR